MTATRFQSGMEIDGFTLGPLEHEGGMGQLFRVTKVGMEQPLLMKIPRLGAGAPWEAVVSFETEACIVPALRGPYVPACLAVGDITRTPYLVFERVEGRDLEHVMEKGALPWRDVVQIGAALADALHHLHQQDVVHLDIKPGNVILRPDGAAVLVDFGFAHHAQYPDLLAEEIRYAVGSAPYVSPEQLLGIRSDPRSDLFGLGVVLYEAVTGRLPFGEPDTDVRNRFWLDPAPPATLVPEVPPWLQEVILRCLEIRVEARCQSAAHVAFDLRNPEQVPLTARAHKRTHAGVWSHLRRFMRAKSEVGPKLREPQTLLGNTPIILVAVDTTELDDPRHPAIRFATSRILALSKEFRLLCLSVIKPSEDNLEHLVRLRHWVTSFRLPAQRLSLHVVHSEDPAETILAFARHNNVDLIVLGAPSGGKRTWVTSTASTVTANAPCSVHVVRVGR